MNVEANQLDKLQALLARIQKNAADLAAARANGAVARAAAQEAELAAPAEADTMAYAEEAEVLEDDLLVTIPPDAPEVTGPEQDTGEFELPAQSRAPSMPSATDVDAPPISTQQHRGEEDMEGLGVSLGFQPSRPPDEAIEHDEEEEEPSAPRTPPPESGPQVSIPPRESLDATAKAAPTMEQLGATIELDGDEASAAELELAEGTSVPSETPDEYEAELPPAEYASAYNEALSSPSTAREELAAHDQAERERQERRSMVPGATTVQASPPEPAARAEADAVVARPPAVVSQPAAIYDSVSPGITPRTFLERLDASLSLGPSGD